MKAIFIFSIVTCLLFSCKKEESAWAMANKHFEKSSKVTAELMGNAEAGEIRSRLEEERRLADLPPRISPSDAEGMVAEKVKALMEVLKEGDVSKIQNEIHPEKGLFIVHGQEGYLDPYFTIKREEFEKYWNEDALVVFNRPGKELYELGIEFKFKQYFQRAYLRDYNEADSIGYNEKVRPSGDYDMIFYNRPDWIVVECYFQREARESVWDSVRFIFQEEKGEWAWIGLMHLFFVID